MSNIVRVRIAPSPTGFAHVGTAYTALFNFAFAQKNKGKFILRLEDTDIKRQVKGAEEAIYEGLKWLGLSWDEGPDSGGQYLPYRQSERLKTYSQWSERLQDAGMAYKEEGAVRFKNSGEDMEWEDLVRGKISFPGGEVTDFVILKSDGFPTYNFSVVVDDILMKISHVIRGEEHISNTPRQLALYKAFKVNPPQFAHLPTLRNKDRKKLSKRRDPVDLRMFREQGYLPEALVNFLCLLGWSHPKGEEIFSLDEFVKLFDIKRVRKAGPIFNIEKLEWLNGEYIRRTQNSKLTTQIFEFFNKHSLLLRNKKYSKQKISEIVPLIKDRIKKFSDFESLAGYVFKTSEDIEPKIVTDNYLPHISNATTALREIPQSEWNIGTINNTLGTVIKQNDFKVGDFYMDLRGTVSGSLHTPPLNETLVPIGLSETIKRLEKGLEKVKSK